MASRKVTDLMRQRIYDLYVAGFTVPAIAKRIGIPYSTLRYEMARGYTGALYIDDRKVYDPYLASAVSKEIRLSRPPIQFAPPVPLGKDGEQL